MANVVQAGNTCTLTLTSLTDAVTATAVNDATVTAQMYDATGTAVGSPVTLSYVAASSGNYRGTLPAATIANFAVGAPYRIKFTITSGSNVGEENVRGVVQERGPT